MRTTVDQEALSHLRTLINYLEEDRQKLYEQNKDDDLVGRIDHAVDQIKQGLDRPRTSHDMAAGFVNVLCMP